MVAMMHVLVVGFLLPSRPPPGVLFRPSLARPRPSLPVLTSPAGDAASSIIDDGRADQAPGPSAPAGARAEPSESVQQSRLIAVGRLIGQFILSAMVPIVLISAAVPATGSLLKRLVLGGPSALLAVFDPTRRAALGVALAKSLRGLGTPLLRAAVLASSAAAVPLAVRTFLDSLHQLDQQVRRLAARRAPFYAGPYVKQAYSKSLWEAAHLPLELGCRALLALWAAPLLLGPSVAAKFAEPLRVAERVATQAGFAWCVGEYQWYIGELCSCRRALSPGTAST